MVGALDRNRPPCLTHPGGWVAALSIQLLERGLCECSFADRTYLWVEGELEDDHQVLEGLTMRPSTGEAETLFSKHRVCALWAGAILELTVWEWVDGETLRYDYKR